MKPAWMTLLFFSMVSTHTSLAQGLSFSFLIPTEGYVSAPVSPFAVRDIGFGDKVGAEFSAALYSIPGLGLDGLSFKTDRPMVGPHWAVLLPIDAFVRIRAKKVSFKLIGGGFLWWNVNPKLMEGNLDRDFRQYEGWTVLNTDLEMDNKLGKGWLAGLEVEIPVNRKISLTIQGNYLRGAAKAGLKGSYVGGVDGSALQTKEVDIQHSTMVLSGTELVFGAILRK